MSTNEEWSVKSRLGSFRVMNGAEIVASTNSEAVSSQIVRDHNGRAALVEALTSALSWLRDAPNAGRPSDDGIDEARNIIRAAIAQAGE